jgi:hypothetical protein
MNGKWLFAFSTRAVGWVGAIVLIAMTSSLVKSNWNDVVYVINGAYLLFGGVWLGEWLASKVLGGPKK